MADRENGVSETAQFPSPATRGTGGSRAAFVFILVTVAMDFLAFGIIAPVLPNLIIQFEGGNIARASAITGYFGFAWATMQSLMSQLVEPSSQGKLQGAINSLRALTGMAGPLLFTQVFSAAISPGRAVHLPGAPYLLATVLLVGSVVLAVVVTRRHAGTAAGGRQWEKD
jgi:hypothetical protein